MRAFNLLANGSGGFDWAGLELVCVHLGVDDVARLIDQMQAIKLHRPPERQAQKIEQTSTLLR